MLIRRKMSTGFISDEIHHKAKISIRDKESHPKFDACNMKYREQKLTYLQAEINKSTIVVGDFKTCIFIEETKQIKYRFE